MVTASALLSPMAWGRLIRENGSCPAPTFYHRGRVILAPPMSVGGPTCHWCLALRLAQVFPHPRVIRPLLSGCSVYSTLGASDPLTAHPELVAALVAARDKLGEETRARTVLSVEIGGDGVVARHYLSPLPGKHGDHDVRAEMRHGFPSSSWDVPWPAVGKRELGETAGAPTTPFDSLVGPLAHRAAVPTAQGEPESLCAWVAVTGFLGQFVTWAPDVSGTGVGYFSDRAREASAGEAVERYCGNYVPLDRLSRHSEDALIALGVDYLPPHAFGAGQRWASATASEQFRSYDPTQEEYWLPGINCTNGKTVLVPAEAATLNFTRRSGRLPLFPVQLTGIAAGETRQQAAESASFELIERDATIRWWNGHRSAAILRSLPARIAELVASPGSAVRQWFLLLESDTGAPVVAACMHDVEYKIVTAGFASRASLDEGVLKASAEAWQSRAISIELLRPDSTLRRDVSQGRIEWPLVEFDPERGYSRFFEPDFSDMDQLFYNVQYYLDPRVQAYALDRFNPSNEVDYGDVEKPQACEEKSAIHLISRAGLGDVVTVDLTTPDFAQYGYSVQRAIAPSLVGMLAAAHCPVWHPRLASDLELDLSPIPHS